MKRKFPLAVLIMSLAMAVCLVLSSVCLLSYSKLYGIIGISTAIFLAVCYVIVYALFLRDSLRHITKMNEHLENSASEYMNTLPAPVAVISRDGKLVWYNSTFTESICKGNDVYGMRIDECIKLNVESLAENGSAICRVNDSVYKVLYEEFTENDITFLIIYFHDETDYHNLKKEADGSRPCVVIINIDSYDEIIQNAKESEKARASVEIEQLMEKFISNTNGFIKKISQNTFYAVMEHRHVENKIRAKFKLLDMARDIKIADGKYSLTLSVGVGEGASNLEESEKIARQCLDMALGRGGDQAVVKFENGYRFFGGVSKGVEKMSRTKSRIIANALQDVIMNSDTVYIMGHRFGDLDSVGSSCGLMGALKLLDKEVHIVTDKSKNLAANLIDMVEKRVGRGIFISPSSAMQMITDNDLLIVVDIHNKDIIESREVYDLFKQVVVIDHHRKAVNFIDNAVIFHHEPNASSASEMVTELIQYFRFNGDSKLPSYCAEALLAGIMLDTKNFVMRTGVRTFEAAAFLKKSGADTVTVKQLFSNSFESYKHKAEIVASAKIHKKYAIAYADFKSDDIRLAAPQAADELLNINGVDASFVIYKTNNVINISARSFGAANVQVIMEMLGGGGHQTMAATQIEDITINEAMQRLIDAIDKREKEISQKE